MLLNVFNQGNKKLFVDVYHLELGGYHEFLVIYEINGPKYLVGSWTDKFTMNINIIPDIIFIEFFNTYLLSMKTVNFEVRKQMLRTLFGNYR